MALRVDVQPVSPSVRIRIPHSFVKRNETASYCFDFKTVCQQFVYTTPGGTAEKNHSTHAASTLNLTREAMTFLRDAFPTGAMCPSSLLLETPSAIIMMLDVDNDDSKTDPPSARCTSDSWFWCCALACASLGNRCARSSPRSFPPPPFRGIHQPPTPSLCTNATRMKKAL